jgi:outer membrane immunogenic protein
VALWQQKSHLAPVHATSGLSQIGTAGIRLGPVHVVSVILSWGRASLGRTHVIRYVIAAAVAATFATPAFAQENTSAPSGFRIEALVGWDHGSIDVVGVTGVSDSIHSDGIMYGVGLGYDIPVGRKIAFGLDLEATESTADAEFAQGTIDVRISAGRDLYAGGRVTFAVSPGVNLYVKAGYTNARFRFSATTQAGSPPATDAANEDGIRGGVGAQFAIGSHAYVGAEYRYSNYQDDISRHQGTLSLGFRF